MDTSFLYFIFAIYTKFVLSEEGVCPLASGDWKCCTGYREVDGKCVLCPKGLYGEECNATCPEGTYGIACREICKCKPEQICDTEHGCVGNVTEQADSTTPGDEPKEDIPLHYFYITPIVIISLLCIVAFLMRCRNRGNRTMDVNNDAENTVTHNVQLEAVAISGPSNQSLSASVSDYAEIRDSSTVYSDSYETSSIYNELSFSKLKALKKMNNPVNSLYDTTAACVVTTEAMLHTENPVNSCYETDQGCVVDTEAILGNENPVKSCYETAQAFGSVAEAAVDIRTPVNSSHETTHASSVTTEAAEDIEIHVNSC